MKKMTKVQLVNTITSLAKEMESKLEKERPDMKDIIKYTLDGYYDNPRNVERAELIKIAGELEDIKNSINTNGTDNKTAGKTTTATTEGNKTSTAGKTTNKNTTKGKISEEEATKRILGVINENSTAGKTTTEKPEASTKKNTNKNGATPKNKPVENKKEESLFPKVLEIKSVGKLKLRSDLKNIEEISDAINNNEDLSLVFATYWNKKDLKKFNYDSLGILNKEEYPLEFEKDFDIMQPVYVSESGKVIYAVSVFTDIMNSFLSGDFEQLDGQRFSNGVEFQVYEVIEG